MSAHSDRGRTLEHYANELQRLDTVTHRFTVECFGMEDDVDKLMMSLETAPHPRFGHLSTCRTVTVPGKNGRPRVVGLWRVVPE